MLGPGTGLGEAQLFWDVTAGGYRVWPSEGAHAQFAPRGWRQRALQAFVESELGYCEVEHVSSPPAADGALLNDAVPLLIAIACTLVMSGQQAPTFSALWRACSPAMPGLSVPELHAARDACA